MESAFNQLIRDGSYADLLEQSSAILSSNPNDSCALAFKGRALACLRQYQDASEVLQGAIRAGGPRKRVEAMKELEKYCRRLSRYPTQYAHYSQTSFPPDWYSSRLLNSIASQSSPTPPPFQPGQACILGPPKELENFSGIDTGVQFIIKEPLLPYPLSQADHSGYLYLKNQAFLLPFQFTGRRGRYYRDSGPQPVAIFPVPQWEQTGPIHQPNPNCDVFHSSSLIDSTTSRLLTWSLDRIAKSRSDFFVPMYHNIIDPNMTALQDCGGGVYRWTACEFAVEEVKIPRIDMVVAVQGAVRRALGKGLPWHSVELILSFLDGFLAFPRAHLTSPLPYLPLPDHNELAVSIESILTSALPLLSKLRKPALLLPGKLQVVLKAQSIYLHPGEDYSGVWHSDGLNESIVAVVLYYYRYSPEMEGGDLEFISRQPRKDVFWLHGDCSPDALTSKETKDLLEELPHCRVPMQQGLLVVFSNYQLVHRVLTMRNNGNEVAKRDFLVMFVVDQRVPLASTRELPQVVDRVASESIRQSLFFEQLQPSGRFGVYSDFVYSTGNGSCALIGWMEANSSDADIAYGQHPDRHGLKALKALSKDPPLGRGISWVLEEEAWEEDEKEEWEIEAEEAEEAEDYEGGEGQSDDPCAV